MARIDVFNEFLSRPRELHSAGYSAMPTYLGVYHNLSVPFIGIGLEQVSLVIALLLLGFSSKAFSKKLPVSVDDLPDDITTEGVYFWGGLTSIYVVRHVDKVIL